VAAANGTVTLHLAYAALVPPGSEILVPAYTFLATASMVVAAGCTPVFCEIDPETLLIDLADAERRITPRTRAIAPVHMFGNVVDRAAVEALARRHDLVVIWDAAQAHGAGWQEQDVATFPPVVSFSLYATKNLFTGEGGMLCTDDADLAARLRLMRSHGQDGTGGWNLLGYNYRLSDIHAAIGVAQFERFPEMAARRRRNSERLAAGLAGVPGLAVQKTTPGTRHGWHRFGLFVDGAAFGRTRDELRAHLQSRGVQTSAYYVAGLHRERFPVGLLGRRSLPVTERISPMVVCLPNHQDLSDADIDRVVEEVRGAAR
jgi:perosamine synthetase